jgi:hypothetical protein
MKLNLLLGLVLGGLAAAKAATITMRVENNAKVADWVLGKAEKDAAFILGQAGVEVAWQHCPPRSVLDGTLNPCQRGFKPNEFWLRLVPQKPPALGDEALGFAIHDPVAGAGGGFAYVSYPMVETLTKTAGTSESQVLGVAIAHEIGHLLLGAAHSQTGIMCVRWRRPHFELMRTGRLLFTPEQAIQIKAEVMRRIAQSSASNER